MAVSRLSLAHEDGYLPEIKGTFVVFGPAGPEVLQGLRAFDPICLQPSKTLADLCTQAGLKVVQEISAPVSVALVVLPRAKSEAFGLIEAAVRLVRGGTVIVDGQKTDGVDSVLKALSQKVTLMPRFAKAHGKTTWFSGASPEDFEAWRVVPGRLDDGAVTAPGVFSADGLDPGSALLLESIPDDVKGACVDLGAGWGALGRDLLGRAPALTALHCVEDNLTALTCARANISDARAHFYWADARTWRPEHPVQLVIMNPPFHTGRQVDLNLGRAFVAAAAACLGQNGRLYMVANAHLPYEPCLEQHFSAHHLIARDTRFKVYEALKGSRARR